MESKKFKTKIFGGFDKTEVMEYINSLQKKYDSYESKTDAEEILALREENKKLASALEKTNEQLAKLSDPVSGSNKMLASSIVHSKTHFDNIASLVNGICNTASENISEAGSNIFELLGMTESTTKDFIESAEKLKISLEKMQSFLNETSEYFDLSSEGSKLAESLKAPEADDAEALLEKGEALMSEIQNQKKANSDILSLLSAGNE